jgi:hypothetical protein
MAGANSNIQVTDLDFNNIKTNLKTFLQSQDVLKDYNYEGSALNVLLDILAYNTQYNAYYTNMVANEMFLDTALLRSSVVSQSKILNYTPRSAIAPSATINLQVGNVTASSLTLPKFTPFISEAIDGVTYSFVTSGAHTVNTNLTTNIALFENVEIKQGLTSTLSYTVDDTTNPKYIFEIPETTVDSSTLTVTVQVSSANNYSATYTPATNFLTLDGASEVYFLQESLSGTYQVYFGDGILGKKLSNGNIVNLSYIVTQGTASAGANSFVIMSTVGGFSNTTTTSITAASQGGGKESIDSIKFQAPKSFAAQGRAVSKNDYITAIQQNDLGYSFDAVSVWGGEENNPPIYGQVFVSIKPAGSFSLTATQKQRIIADVINPISVVTVTPTIVDPDYTYLKLVVNLIYDQTKTSQTSTQIAEGVRTAIQNFGTNTLNTFNSTFNSYELLTAVQNYSPAIISSEYKLQLQKKFLPNLTNPTTYNLYFDTPLQTNRYTTGINSYPGMSFRDTVNFATIIEGVYIEEVPSSTNSVETISVINPGFSYTTAPIVTILGDGTGATAHAIVSGTGYITSIVIDDGGNGYTSALVIITAADGDTSGQNGAAIANLSGRYGTLRTYYNNTTQVKTIINSNIGTVDYQTGTITLNSFAPYDVADPLGQFSVIVTPSSSIISSSYNKIITIDPFDSQAITVNVTAKT